MRTLTSAIALVSLSPLLTAQYALHESRGVLAGAPTTVQVDMGLGAGGDCQARVHRSGFGVGPTTTFPSGVNAPDLRQILLQFLTAAQLGSIDFDDFSMGRDEILIDDDGTVNVPPSSWAVLSFSLRNGATGIAGSRIQQEASQGQIGAALFTRILPGSNLPLAIVNRTERSHSRQDLGLPVGQEVDGVDFATLLGIEQSGLTAVEPGFGPLIESAPGIPSEIYFTVSHATRAAVPTTWWGNAPTVNRSGATILRVARGSSGTWGPPSVYKVWFQLGLGQDEDIDALAVDRAADKVLFSCVGTARDQFLMVGPSTDGNPPAPSTVQTANGPLSQQVGKAQSDDVDAVCTLDPVIGTNGGLSPGGDDFGSSCGMPGNGLLGVPSVHASAFRRYSGGTTFFDTWLVGWPPNTSATAGIAVPFVTFGNALDLVQLGPVQLRNPADPTPGNPLAQSLAIPPALSLSGLSITFRWAAIDANFTELAEAWPVRVFL
ncbi:MAG: hypothetical protein JNK15_25675 [Planctomycetes bacterium]|nr:hypothetical protein [Planctomycetota bacterium]